MPKQPKSTRRFFTIYILLTEMFNLKRGQQTLPVKLVSETLQKGLFLSGCRKEIYERYNAFSL